MKLRHVLVEVESGGFYLDTAREERVSAGRSMAVTVLLLVAAVVVFVLWRTGRL